MPTRKHYLCNANSSGIQSQWRGVPKYILAVLIVYLINYHGRRDQFSRMMWIHHLMKWRPQIDRAKHSRALIVIYENASFTIMYLYLIFIFEIFASVRIADNDEIGCGETNVFSFEVTTMYYVKIFDDAVILVKMWIYDLFVCNLFAMQNKKHWPTGKAKAKNSNAFTMPSKTQAK